MSKVNVKLAGASYSDVPAIILNTPDGKTVRFLEISDTTATADDVLEGKIFYGADGKLVTGVHVGEFTETTGDIIVESPDKWSYSITQADHQTISVIPTAKLIEDGSYYASGLTFEQSITADTGYTPGTLKKTIDKTKRNITLTAGPAHEIESMFKDGYLKVYRKNNNYYSDENYTNYINKDQLKEKILVANGDSNITDESYTSPTRNNTLLTDYNDTFLTEAGGYLLSGCTGLTSVDLSNLTVSGKFYDAFTNCSNLKSVKLNLTKTTCLYSTFNHGFFKGCDKMEELIMICSTVVSVSCDADVDTAVNYLPSTCKIYVPESLVDDYKADSTWGTKFGANILPIENYTITKENGTITITEKTA